jgi:hypothetical protein
VNDPRRRPPVLPTSSLLSLAVVVLLASEAAAVPKKIQIVLDMSGSMAAKDQGGTRADSARKAIAKALETIPGDVPVSLRLYGHRVDKEQKEESCKDTERVVDFTENASPKILAALAAAKPLGQTPIAYSLRKAAEDLGPADETKDTVILLVTDGDETCGGNPEALVDELLRLGYEMRIYTVGLGVDRDTKRRLEQVATKTGGTYTDAANTAKLQKALADAADDILRGPRVSTAPIVPYAKDVKGSQRLITHCRPGEALRQKLSDLAPIVIGEEKFGGGMLLSMEITEVEGSAGGIWTGPKEVAASGTLKRGNQVIGTFEAKHSSLGGILKSGGTCPIVHRAAERIAEDVAEWLKAPKMGARLGDL